jgi:hypothetical protein
LKHQDLSSIPYFIWLFDVSNTLILRQKAGKANLRTQEVGQIGLNSGFLKKAGLRAIKGILEQKKHLKIEVLLGFGGMDGNF